MQVTKQQIAEFFAQVEEKKRNYELVVRDSGRFENADPLLQTLQRAASVRGWFNPNLLVGEFADKGTPSAIRSTVVHKLRAMCVVDTVNPDRWILQDRFRKASLVQMASDKTLVETARKAGQDPYSQLLVSMLSGDFDPSQATTEQLAAAGDVDRWLAAISGKGRKTHDFSGELELNLRNDELDRLSRDIVGRDHELHQLLKFVDVAWRQGRDMLPLYRLQGIGGVGKSTLLAEFVRRRMVARYGDAIVIWIDYDRLRIRANELPSVLIEIARQLSWALPDTREALKAARSHLRDFAAERVLTATSQASQSAKEVSESADADPVTGSEEQVAMRAMTEILAHALRPFRSELDQRPVLVVLDTVEQIERSEAGRGDVLVALRTLRLEALGKLAVVASGRSVFSRDRLPWGVEDHPGDGLTGLSREFSKQLLVKREKLITAEADRLLAAFTDLTEEEFRQRIGVPMLLTLLARLHREGRLDLSSGDLEEIRSAANAEMAAAYIYHRVLEHLPNELRRLAHPGLILRQVTEEILREVIWPVIEPKEAIDPEKSEKLFEQLTREVWLVEAIADSESPAVQHRSELRRAMLLLMYDDEKPAVRRELVALNQRARDWYRRRMRDRPNSASECLLDAVYHSVALAVLTGKVGGLRISEIRAVRDRLKEFVTDFPEAHRPAVSALITGESDPATIARLPATLRVPVLAEKFRTFVNRRQYRECLAFCAELPKEDRGRTPALAWLAVRCFLQSGQWASREATIRPVIEDNQAAGFRFGKGRPSALPYMAAFASPGMGPATALDLACSPKPAGITDWVSRRYDIISALFAQLDSPGEANLANLEGNLVELYSSLRRRYASGDRRRFAAILTSVQLRRHPDMVRCPPNQVHGLAQIGLPGIAELARQTSSISSARLVTLCRSVDAELARVGSTRQPITPHWVAVFDDFHTPLGLALAEAIQSSSDAYTIADSLWDAWPIRPYDFRPAVFAQVCEKADVRPERFKTLVALADRAELTPLLLESIRNLAAKNADLGAVVATISRWRTALAPLRKA